MAEPSERQIKESVVRLYLLMYMADIELSYYNFGYGTKYLNETGKKAMIALKRHIEAAKDDLNISDTEFAADTGDMLWETIVMLTCMDTAFIKGVRDELKKVIHESSLEESGKKVHTDLRVGGC